MSTFRELYGVSQAGALQFFFTELTDLAPEKERLTRRETLYVASILARYAQTSRYENDPMPLMADLAEVFDNFVLGFNGTDPSLLELAGAQSLLFAGFFGDQMRRRHNLDYFVDLGEYFYDRASYHTSNLNRRILFGLMSSHFPTWTRYCQRLSRTLRDNRFLIKPPRLEP